MRVGVTPVSPRHRRLTLRRVGELALLLRKQFVLAALVVLEIFADAVDLAFQFALLDFRLQQLARYAAIAGAPVFIRP
jgi:hypothetical protein